MELGSWWLRNCHCGLEFLALFVRSSDQCSEFNIGWVTLKGELRWRGCHGPQGLNYIHSTGCTMDGAVWGGGGTCGSMYTVFHIKILTASWNETNWKWNQLVQMWVRADRVCRGWGCSVENVLVAWVLGTEKTIWHKLDMCVYVRTVKGRVGGDGCGPHRRRCMTLRLPLYEENGMGWMSIGSNCALERGGPQ